MKEASNSTHRVTAMLSCHGKWMLDFSNHKGSRVGNKLTRRADTEAEVQVLLQTQFADATSPHLS